MRWFWIIAAGSALAGCGTLPEPVLTGLTPDLAWNGQATSIVLTGENFYPQIQLSAGQKGGSTVDDGYEASLVDPEGPTYKLPGVEIIDDTHIGAVVPAGLDDGTYGVRIVGPGGKAHLDDVFEVSNSKADHIRVRAAGVEVLRDVNKLVLLEIDLLDANDEIVFENPEFFPVRVTIVDGDGMPPVLETLTNTLDGGWSPAEGIILGNLQRGSARVDVRSQLAQEVRVTVEPDGRSNIVHGEANVVFQATTSHLEIRLPGDDFSTVAGDPFDVELEFVDNYGNPDLQDHEVFLSGTCSTFILPQVVTGKTIVTLDEEQISVACPNERLTALLLEHVESDSFEVLPGPIDHFDVQVESDPIAGSTLRVALNSRDRHDNPVTWLGINQEFTFQDSVGGAGDVETCTMFNQNTQFHCDVWTYVAAPSVYLHVEGDDGTVGDSQVAYTVHPGKDPASLDVTVLGTPVAGEPFDVDAAVYDDWGNQIDAADFSSDPFVVSDELGEVVCDPVVFGIDGSADFVCVLETARPGAIITVTLDNGVVEGSAAPTRVDNGALAAVTVEAFGPFQAIEVAAGETIFLDFAGVDSFGNPYIVQTDPDLDVDDTTGTLSVNAATLGLDGTVQVQATVSVAGDTAITASQGGDLLGTSPIITVTPAGHDRLLVTVAEPWAWLGSPTEVRVESVDAFGNRTDWSGTATIVSRMTGTAPLEVTLTNGIGVDYYLWDSTALDEVVDASTPTGLVGESAALHVVEDCPVAGPTADVDFGGYDHSVVCYDPVAEEGLLSASFAASVSGGAPLTSYALAVDVPAQMSGVNSMIFSVDEIGAHSLRALVVQTDGCADEIATTAWVGLDDGQAVGPIGLSPVDPVIDAGIGDTTVNIESVTDCARDPAVNSTVFVRTTLGSITGLTESGRGLVAVLDVNGDGFFTLSASSTTTGGLAEIHAWVDSGAARGRADVDVQNDDEQPHVWEQFPSGETLSMVREIRLVFSEPMLDNQLLPGHFSVTGPSVATVDTVTPENGDTEVVLTLLADVDGAAGIWTVTASDNLRDASGGNRLDGAWVGGRSDYVGTFGAVAAPGDSVTCAPVTPEGGLFRPDGDDGLDAERDTVSVELTTAVAPAWWVISVTNQANADLIRRNYEVPGGAVDIVHWDGRDGRGLIVENGNYEVRIEPEDGLGNLGVGCGVVAIVDNVMGDAP